MYFRWIEWYIAKCEKHGVHPADAEYVVEHARNPFPRRIEQGKLLVWGQTMHGLFLQVIYLLDSDGTAFRHSCNADDRAAEGPTATKAEKKMRKKQDEYQRFMKLSDAAKDAEVAKFDREIDFNETKPLSPGQRALWNKAKRKRGRPRIGKGVEVISLSVEKDLLRKADRAAKDAGISRAALFAQGLHAILRRAS